MSIARIMPEEPQVVNPYHKKRKHLTNAAVTVAGAGASAALFAKGHRRAEEILLSDMYKINSMEPLSTIKPKGKIYKFFEATGEKLFSDNTKLGQMIKRYVDKKYSIPGYWPAAEKKARIKNYKTVGAMALAAGLAGLAFLVNGLHQAKKINSGK